jgi:cell division protein ZapA
VAVLAALNISDELYKLQEDYDSLAKLLEEEKLIK